MNFFGPAWRSKNEKKAIAAIGKMDDQELLQQAALEAYGSARLAAIERLSDESKLMEVALHTRLHEERHKAITKITDESLLAKLALVNGDSSLLPRITKPELLFNIALNANIHFSATAFSKLRDTVDPAGLRAVLTKKARNSNEKNMPAVLQMLKTIEPDRWKTYCSRETIDALMDLRYWGELSKISGLLWDFYRDDTFRAIVNQAEDDYQNQKQQWEGEYNHIIEMLFYLVKEKQNLQAAHYIQAMYCSGAWRAYIKKHNAKTEARHIDETSYGACYFEWSSYQVAYEDDSHTDKNVAAEYYVPLGFEAADE
ncbi:MULTISPECIES: hypothetical protein [Dehalobacter]|jgi:hypothetical protein|uniref:DUF1266 domain-containing protein n=1 Tax=Dehalobacter restrictus (strain DSM 9455 / PER-K23) TaxID=871738 RepID=A0ABM5P9F2_DEHRP|nr:MULTISPECIES: hypothetical protein [Dehalobacter]AHF11430.1 hypothetical protein DEHRE_10705 [Dehalobacter restrictus DSM 9455]MDJ0304872.1 hypothetical protein [Dehalobacter sp.]